jgi:hypothetical protein
MQIGTGGVADVYKGRCRGKPVAVKKLKDHGDGLIEQAYEVV